MFAALLLIAILCADQPAKEIPEDAVVYFEAEEKYAESLRQISKISEFEAIRTTASVAFRGLKSKSTRPNLFRIAAGDIGFLPEIVEIDEIIDDSTCIVTHDFPLIILGGGATANPPPTQILIRGVSTKGWADGERHAIRPCLLIREPEKVAGWGQLQSATAVDFRAIEKYRADWNKMKKDKEKKTKAEAKTKPAAQ